MKDEKKEVQTEEKGVELTDEELSQVSGGYKNPPGLSYEIPLTPFQP